MSRRAKIKLLPSQAKFYSSNIDHTAYIGGFRSGKSFTGTSKTIKKKLQYPGINVAYYLPTYGLVNDVALPLFDKHLSNLELSFKVNLSRHEIITDYGKIIMRSMNDPDGIIGYEVGYSCMDEIDVMPQTKAENAFVKIIARNSEITPDGINSTDLVSTPEGFGFAYNFFKKAKKNNRLLIQAKTHDNPFLAAGYINTLKESYTPAQLQAYLNGEFVNLTSGSVYGDYERNVCHSSKVIKKHDKLHIGMDFNITNMNAVVHVIDQDIKIAVDEITHAYDTMQMIRIINEKYKGHSITIYPDASGKNRSTSGKSDIQLLIDAGFTVRSPNKNPFIRDRVNAMNKLFRDKKYFVNSHNCPEYTEALEKIAYDNNEPDKKSGFDHITDAGGYFAYGISRVGFTI